MELQDNELWAPVRGHESAYEVSASGAVRSLRRCDSLGRERPPKILRLWKRDRYFLVDLYKEGSRTVAAVHRLVYEAFVGAVASGDHVHHKDGDCTNNCVDNLEAVNGARHIADHAIGRPAWNKGTRYGCTEAYRKSNETRRKNHAAKRELAIRLRRDGRSAKAISEIIGVGVRQVYSLLRPAEGDRNVRN